MPFCIVCFKVTVIPKARKPVKTKKSNGRNFNSKNNNQTLSNTKNIILTMFFLNFRFTYFYIVCFILIVEAPTTHSIVVGKIELCVLK